MPSRKERPLMENNYIERTPTLLKKDEHFYLALTLSNDMIPIIDLTDDNQENLDEQFVDIIKYVITNEKPVKFGDLEIDQSVSKEDDIGVINIAKEYIPILNNEIKTMYDEWMANKL